MIKTLVKLLVVAAAANATWHIFIAFSAHYRFKDSVQEMSQYSGSQSDDEVRNRVLALAAQYEVPVDSDDISVRREENHTIIDGSYTRPVDLLPGYTYDWPFSWHIDTFVTSPGKYVPNR